MDKWVKLHIRKQFINLAVRIINKLFPSQEPQWPQTQILEEVYEKMLNAYQVEAWCGRFDDIPHQILETLKDKNFLRMLQLGKNLLIYLGDVDRYYRQWLGLFMLLIREYVEMLEDVPLSEDFIDWINSQWAYGIPNNSFFKEFFDKHRGIAAQAALANNLPNLVTLTLNRGEKHAKQHTSVRP